MKRELVLQRALELACERIADGPQQYHEANTPEGWAEVYQAQALAQLQCPACGGSGRRFEDPCATCGGEGLGDCMSGDGKTMEKPFTWKSELTVEVDPVWVADGFDLTPDRLNRILTEAFATELAYAHPSEVRVGARIITAPAPADIAKEQGY